MASLSLCPPFETNLMSNRKVIELLLKSAKDLGKNYIKVKPHLVRHLLRNRLLILNKCWVISLTFSSPGPFERFFSLTKAQQPLVRIESNFRKEKYNNNVADHEKI